MKFYVTFIIFSHYTQSLDMYSSQNEHFIVLGDFNVEMKNRDMEEFCKDYNLKSFIQVPTCYKSPNNL